VRGPDATGGTPQGQTPQAKTPQSRGPHGRTRAGRTIAIGESLGEVSRKLGMPDPETISSVFDYWLELVGADLGRYVHPEKIDGEALFVNADSPAWASHLRTIAPVLVERFRDQIGPDAPSRFVIRVRPPR
jgi:predicted nucleic acid-binding Zn ribbon protein